MRKSQKNFGKLLAAGKLIKFLQSQRVIYFYQHLHLFSEEGCFFRCLPIIRKTLFNFYLPASSFRSLDVIFFVLVPSKELRNRVHRTTRMNMRMGKRYGDEYDDEGRCKYRDNLVEK